MPSEGPENVQAVAISSTSVNVTWGDVPTLEQNGMILGFKVKTFILLLLTLTTMQKYNKKLKGSVKNLLV